MAGYNYSDYYNYSNHQFVTRETYEQAYVSSSSLYYITINGIRQTGTYSSTFNKSVHCNKGDIIVVCGSHTNGYSEGTHTMVNGIDCYKHRYFVMRVKYWDGQYI